MSNSPITNEQILAALPHPIARPGQIEAIKFILNSFQNGKDFVFLEGPVGSGKSAIGIAVSDFFTNSYYLTVQKFLQTQLSNDYGQTDDVRRNLVDVKGRNAYPCSFYERFGAGIVKRGGMRQVSLDKALERKPNCDEGYCTNSGKYKCAACFPPADSDAPAGGRAWQNEMGVRFSTCQYYEQVYTAMESRKVLMNFSSFLYQTSYTSRFGTRDLLIIDEGHHIEEQLMGFVSFTFSDRILFGDLELPDYDDPSLYAIWFHDNKIADIITGLTRIAHEAGRLKEEDELTSLNWKLGKFMKCISDGMDKWVVEFKVNQVHGLPPYRTVVMQPIFVQHFANDLIFKFGQKVLIMSATILDARVMATALAIPPAKMAFCRMPNNFPVKNRPIYIIPAVKATGGKKQQAVWGPPMMKWINGIVKRYSGKRGIIHTHNFSIAHMVMNDGEERHRFLFQENYKSKEDMLAEHKSRTDSIIVAPAMHEGLNLFGDLSRFQIICKTPWPNFFDDQQLAKRIENDQRYLHWMVALRLVQAYGRSIRSADDWAHTYIIDSAVCRFLHDAGTLIPKWFTEAIEHVKI